MQPVLRRIAIHGAVAAVILGVIGVMFAELASMWLATPAPAPTGGPVQVAAPNSNVADTLHRQVPFRMALFGFIIVAIGETLLHVVRKRTPATPAPATHQPDEAEKLLEQLLAQSESRAVPSPVGGGLEAGTGTPAPLPEPQSSPKP